MSDKDENSPDKAKKPLSLKKQGSNKAGRISDTGQVRQSFSHGRSRSVAVEVRRKRSIKGGGVSAPSSTKISANNAVTTKLAPPSTPNTKSNNERPSKDTPKSRVVLRTLTQEEKATRAKAVEVAVKE